MAHDHDHDEASHLSEMDLRVRALETILVEKGYIESAALDRIIELYETKIGPHIGAQVIAKAWSDPAFRNQKLNEWSQFAREKYRKNIKPPLVRPEWLSLSALGFIVMGLVVYSRRLKR